MQLLGERLTGKQLPAKLPSRGRMHMRVFSHALPNPGNKGPFENGNNPNKNLSNNKMLNALGTSSDRIGSEYGEGFIQFRLSGEQIHLDVDKLNEQMKIKGADRLRQANHPDEAFGLIFDLDNVIFNTRDIQRASWKRLAEQEGLPYPDIERQIWEISPLRAITEVFQWTRNMQRAQELAWLLAGVYVEMVKEVDESSPGVAEWLKLVKKNKVPCALVTSLDRITTSAILDKLHLRQYFSATVTADDDMETISQRYLSAAIKLGRPPEQCVVFAGCPSSVIAAHNCTMRACAILGAHTAPQLRHADLTVGSLSELSVYNIRRLFANKGAQLMDLNKGVVGAGPPKRRITHATMDEDGSGGSTDNESDAEFIRPM